MKLKTKASDRMEQQIFSKILEELTKGNQKGSFRIYVNKSNVNWTLYYENYIYLDVKFETKEKYVNIHAEGMREGKFGKVNSLYLMTSIDL